MASRDFVVFRPGTLLGFRREDGFGRSVVFYRVVDSRIGLDDRVVFQSSALERFLVLDSRRLNLLDEVVYVYDVLTFQGPMTLYAPNVEGHMERFG